ncbi:hypothetical protein PAHAL_9G579900 [Panicum hallii]|uniref:4Fe-4S ferredoxin-type domain-containing protein n=1 Tax=Panicum hallii TaxID=206008 RepID=A0A2T8I644_9POAL|nr:hypothetical protein PAHAL_9G579900 [Panicum hallii]
MVISFSLIHPFRSKMNMRCKYGGLGCLAMMAPDLGCIAPGRPHFLDVGTARSHASSLITERSRNATTLDETKVKLVFCAQVGCVTHDCFCCLNQKPKPLCYDTKRECKAGCPHCVPVCPP